MTLNDVKAICFIEALELDTQQIAWSSSPLKVRSPEDHASNAYYQAYELQLLSLHVPIIKFSQSE
jgi:hypothetical protein